MIARRSLSLVDLAGIALTVALALDALFGGAPATAETSKSFPVTADIVTGCLVATDAGGSWGKISLGTVAGVQSGSVSANLMANAAAGLQISCTPGTTLSATADNGNQPSGGVRQLALSGYSSRVPYLLYANNSTTPWTTQSIALSFPIGTQFVALPVKGTATLPGVQRAGTYTDTVRITLSW